MATTEQSEDLKQIMERRTALKHAGTHALEITNEIRRLLRIGLEATRRYKPYINITTFESMRPLENDEFVSWAKGQDCREDYKKIQLRWTAGSVSYVLKPLQSILPGFEHLESALKEHELYEPIPNPTNSYDKYDDTIILQAYIEKLYYFAHDIVNADGWLGESVKMLQQLQERMDADMSQVNKEAVHQFRTAEDKMKRKQVETLWEALTDDKSDRRLEHGWFRENALLLRILVSLYFRDGVKVIRIKAEELLESITSEFKCDRS
ncbi:hypothetical protein B5807_00049 [Epicoccum nigrum]|uniref:Uncharacterized protein n=1 Tax=Epicoccum nigrum TaxID=105696 RepID=A0A1Y2MBX6_EPING|nr:hypothetical protein B5807_00049 [Epicoccum nigrum]